MFCLIVSEMDCSARQYELVQCLAFFFYFMFYILVRRIDINTLLLNTGYLIYVENNQFREEIIDDG